MFYTATDRPWYYIHLYTRLQCSLQLLCGSSLPCRIKLCHNLNRFRVTYESDRFLGTYRFATSWYHSQFNLNSSLNGNEILVLAINGRPVTGAGDHGGRDSNCPWTLPSPSKPTTKWPDHISSNTRLAIHHVEGPSDLASRHPSAASEVYRTTFKFERPSLRAYVQDIAATYKLYVSQDLSGDHHGQLEVLPWSLAPTDEKNDSATTTCEKEPQLDRCHYSLQFHSFSYFGPCKLLFLVIPSLIHSLDFRYATKFELILDFVGFVAAVATGATHVSHFPFQKRQHTYTNGVIEATDDVSLWKIDKWLHRLYSDSLSCSQRCSRCSRQDPQCCPAFPPVRCQERHLSGIHWFVTIMSSIRLCWFYNRYWNVCVNLHVHVYLGVHRRDQCQTHPRTLLEGLVTPRCRLLR